LVALFFNVIPCCWLYYQYGHLYDGAISPTMCHVIGISFQIYITLDGLDGKQARKTGNSSPAGMLFDHFADAVTASINSSLMQRIFCTG
jgi:ethanolaminephosphotransferase